MSDLNVMVNTRYKAASNGIDLVKVKNLVIKDNSLFSLEKSYDIAEMNGNIEKVVEVNPAYSRRLIINLNSASNSDQIRVIKSLESKQEILKWANEIWIKSSLNETVKEVTIYISNFTSAEIISLANKLKYGDNVRATVVVDQDNRDIINAKIREKEVRLVGINNENLSIYFDTCLGYDVTAKRCCLNKLGIICKDKLWLSIVDSQIGTVELSNSKNEWLDNIRIKIDDNSIINTFSMGGLLRNKLVAESCVILPDYLPEIRALSVVNNENITYKIPKEVNSLRGLRVTGQDKGDNIDIEVKLLDGKRDCVANCSGECLNIKISGKCIIADVKQTIDYLQVKRIILDLPNVSMSSILGSYIKAKELIINNIDASELTYGCSIGASADVAWIDKNVVDRGIADEVLNKLYNKAVYVINHNTDNLKEEQLEKTILAESNNWEAEVQKFWQQFSGGEKAVNAYKKALMLQGNGGLNSLGVNKNNALNYRLLKKINSITKYEDENSITYGKNKITEEEAFEWLKGLTNNLNSVGGVHRPNGDSYISFNKRTKVDIDDTNKYSIVRSMTNKLLEIISYLEENCIEVTEVCRSLNKMSYENIYPYVGLAIGHSNDSTYIMLTVNHKVCRIWAVGDRVSRILLTKSEYTNADKILEIVKEFTVGDLINGGTSRKMTTVNGINLDTAIAENWLCLPTMNFRIAVSSHKVCEITDFKKGVMQREQDGSDQLFMKNYWAEVKELRNCVERYKYFVAANTDLKAENVRANTVQEMFGIEAFYKRCSIDNSMLEKLVKKAKIVKTRLKNAMLNEYEIDASIISPALKLMGRKGTPLIGVNVYFVKGLSSSYNSDIYVSTRRFQNAWEDTMIKKLPITQKYNPMCVEAFDKTRNGFYIMQK